MFGNRYRFEWAFYWLYPSRLPRPHFHSIYEANKLFMLQSPLRLRRRSPFSRWSCLCFPFRCVWRWRVKRARKGRRGKIKCENIFMTLENWLQLDIRPAEGRARIFFNKLCAVKQFSVEAWRNVSGLIESKLDSMDFLAYEAISTFNTWLGAVEPSLPC